MWARVRGDAVPKWRLWVVPRRLVCSAPAAREGEVEGEKRQRRRWSAAETRRAFLEGVAAELGVETMEDWRKVTTSDIRERGGRGLLRRYGESVFGALRDTFPEQHFTEEQVRSHRPKGYWKLRENRRSFLAAVAEAHGVEEARDWRRVTAATVREMGGGALLKRQGGLLAALRDAFPEEDFAAAECRASLPRDHWGERENRRAFMAALADTHGVERPEDWRRVTVHDVRAAGGAGLLRCYRSLHGLLQDLGDGCEAQSAAVTRAKLPRNYWSDATHVRAFLEEAAQAYDVRRDEDWYRVSNEQLRAVRGGGVLRRMRLIDALRIAYPEKEWDEESCANKTKKAAQREVLLALRRLLPSATIVEEHRHVGLSNVSDSGNLELDLYLPEHEVGVEYHGEHHYTELAHFGALELYQRRDRAKARKCRAAGIRLVVVPCWWDRSAEALAATLHAQCPSLLRAEAERAAAA